MFTCAYYIMYCTDLLVPFKFKDRNQRNNPVERVCLRVSTRSLSLDVSKRRCRIGTLLHRRFGFRTLSHLHEYKHTGPSPSVEPSVDRQQRRPSPSSAPSRRSDYPTFSSSPFLSLPLICPSSIVLSTSVVHNGCTAAHY